MTASTRADSKTTSAMGYEGADDLGRRSTSDAPSPSYGGRLAYSKPASLPFPLPQGAFGGALPNTTPPHASPLPVTTGSLPRQKDGRETPQAEARSTPSVSTPAEAEAPSSKRIPCSFYLKTGNCAFGTECKFEHPLDQPITQYNSLGLPLRPGEPDCAYYVRNLHCGYGASCKFNHNEPVYSWMPVPIMDGHMPLQPIGLPMTALHNPISSAQPTVMLPPQHAMEGMMQSPISRPQLAQPPQMHPLTGPAALPSAFRPAVPHVGYLPQPRIAPQGSPAYISPAAPHMLQAMGAHSLLPQMPAAGLAPGALPAAAMPGGMYPGFLPPALMANAALFPTASGSLLYPGPQPPRPDSRAGEALQVSDSSGQSKSQDSRNKRRMRSSRTGDSQSSGGSSRQLLREPGQGGKSSQSAGRKEKPGAKPAAKVHSRSASSESCSEELKKLSIAPPEDQL